ncbi:hypothetical protein JTB14_034653 [Gonioctena quinquepunctata]|nr:hypothetical protein JTB14_034653 [Gonioctena quinquepunctata]
MRDSIHKYNSRIMHLNIRSLTNKVNPLEAITTETSPDILISTGAAIKYEDLPTTASQGFKLKEWHCRDKMKMGGLCIFAKEEISNNITKIDVEKFTKDSISEFAC